MLGRGEDLLRAGRLWALSDPYFRGPNDEARRGVWGRGRMCSEVSYFPQPSSEPGRREEMPSEVSLAEPVPTSHFTGQ